MSVYAGGPLTPDAAMLLCEAAALYEMDMTAIPCGSLGDRESLAFSLVQLGLLDSDGGEAPFYRVTTPGFEAAHGYHCMCCDECGSDMARA